MVRESEESPEYGGEYSGSWRTILFNCNCHTFDDVITQLVKCHLSQFQAEFTAYEIHTKALRSPGSHGFQDRGAEINKDLCRPKDLRRQGIVYEGSKPEAEPGKS